MKPLDEKSREEILVERQTARGLLSHAKEFNKATNLISEHVGTDFLSDGLSDPDYHNPFYYLCGHSLELAMKATLLASGKTHKYLSQKISHDLEKCFRIVRQCYPDEAALQDDELAAIIPLLNRSYKQKEFEYRITGAKTWPSVSPLLYSVEELCLFGERVVKRAEQQSS